MKFNCLIHVLLCLFTSMDGRNLTDRRDPVAESELGDAQYYRLFARAFTLSAGVRF